MKNNHSYSVYSLHSVYSTKKMVNQSLIICIAFWCMTFFVYVMCLLYYCVKDLYKDYTSWKLSLLPVTLATPLAHAPTIQVITC